MHVGVFRMPGVTPTWKAALLAACWAGPFPSAISHRAGAGLYELPGGRTDLIELTCKRWLRSRHEGLIVHESRRFDAADITDVDGIPTMKPERVLFELASRRPNPQYLEAVIQAARRKRLITYASTLDAFSRHARRGVPGIQALRIALDRWDPESRPTESEMETLLVQVLRDRGLPEVTTQFDVCDKRGELVARTDAAIPEWRVTIDYDSKQEHSDEFQIARDSHRRNRILGAGYAPLVARHGDLVNGGRELRDEITNARREWRHLGTARVPE